MRIQHFKCWVLALLKSVSILLLCFVVLWILKDMSMLSRTLCSKFILASEKYDCFGYSFVTLAAGVFFHALQQFAMQNSSFYESSSFYIPFLFFLPLPFLRHFHSASPRRVPKCALLLFSYFLQSDTICTHCFIVTLPLYLYKNLSVAVF